MWAMGKFAIVLVCVSLVPVLGRSTAAQEPVGEMEFLVDHFAENQPEPYLVSNASLHGEQVLSAKYWRPIRPRQPAVVVYRFESPFPIARGKLQARMFGYFGFDAMVEGRVEVSVDERNWIALGQISTDTEGPMYMSEAVMDVSEPLRGARTVFVRGWMQNSVKYTNFGVPQWLRQDPDQGTSPPLRLWLAADPDAQPPAWATTLEESP
jgi:hypothetical protein